MIEDERDVREGLQDAMQIDDHQVEIACARAPRGSEKARQFNPDVVLCDIGLPGMSGYDVARAFRADPALRSAFLVALSGYNQATDLDRAGAAGFDRHLAKADDHLEDPRGNRGGVRPARSGVIQIRDGLPVVQCAPASIQALMRAMFAADNFCPGGMEPLLTV